MNGRLVVSISCTSEDVKLLKDLQTLLNIPASAIWRDALRRYHEIMTEEPAQVGEVPGQDPDLPLMGVNVKWQP